MNEWSSVEDVQELFHQIANAKTSNVASALIEDIQQLEGNGSHIGSIRVQITDCCEELFPATVGNKEKMNITFGAICDMNSKVPFNVVKDVHHVLDRNAQMNPGIWVKLLDAFKLFVDKRGAALLEKQRKEKTSVSGETEDKKDARKPNVFIADFAPGTIMTGVIDPFSFWPCGNATKRDSKPFENKVSRYIESSIDPNVVYVVQEDAMSDSQEEDPDALEPDFDVSHCTFLKRISKEERHLLRVQALAGGWIRRARDTPGSSGIHCAPSVFQNIAKYSYFKEEDGVRRAKEEDGVERAKEEDAVGRAHCAYCAKMFISQ